MQEPLFILATKFRF